MIEIKITDPQLIEKTALNGLIDYLKTFQSTDLTPETLEHTSNMPKVIEEKIKPKRSKSKTKEPTFVAVEPAVFARPEGNLIIHESFTFEDVMTTVTLGIKEDKLKSLEVSEILKMYGLKSLQDLRVQNDLITPVITDLKRIIDTHIVTTKDSLR